jgi:uncharacterized membrane protein HdeD (DUF308 family)
MSDIHIEIRDVNGIPLTLDWWAVALRGVLAILFGIFAFLMPGPTIVAFVLLFAVYMLLDGVFAIVSAVRAVRRHERWALLALEGVVDLAAGAVAIAVPLITAIILIYVMAGWAIASGILLLIAAFRQPVAQGKWAMRVGAIVSIIWGVLLLIAPLLGALVLTWWIAAYALFFGGALLVFAFQLRRVQTHGMPSPRFQRV